MKRNKKDGLPTVSGPTPGREAMFSVPPPQIEGYQIVSQLGEAGQGRVWRAIQLSTHREVALKVPRVDLLRSRGALGRFEREVELTARLTHPNIARIYDSGLYQGIYYYAMELIEGTRLDEYAGEHKLTTRQTLELMRTVCEAVQHAHQNGVIHRDIKPSNIIVSVQDGQVIPKVIDFGVAKVVAAPLANGTSFTEQGQLVGTPEYMSPEQVSGHQDALDTRSDIYSLGVVLYRVLTGSFPYDVKSSMLQTLRNIQETEPLRPSRLMQHLDADVEAIVLKALAKEPDRRYQSVAELRHDITCWLAGLPILARSDSSLYLLRKVIARHRYTTAVVALLLVIILAFSIFSLQLYGKLRRSNAQLQETVHSLYEESDRYMAFAQQAGIARFLQAWHQSNLQHARFIASFYGRGTPEAAAARFFLDLRPLPEKITEFRKELQESNPPFLEFVIAEHHLKDGNEQEAIRAYQQCLSHRDHLKDNQWLIGRVQSRLYELNIGTSQGKASVATEGDD